MKNRIQGHLVKSVINEIKPEGKGSVEEAIIRLAKSKRDLKVLEESKTKALAKADTKSAKKNAKKNNSRIAEHITEISTLTDQLNDLLAHSG